jgi:hypothetical protein
LAAAAFASFSIDTKYGLVNVLRINEMPTAFPVDPAAGLDATAGVDATAGLDEIAGALDAAAVVAAGVEAGVEAVAFGFDELHAVSTIAAHTVMLTAAARARPRWFGRRPPESSDARCMS